MFAGPNGSGKSTVKATIAEKNRNWLAVYINPDEIEADVREKGFLNFSAFKIKTNANEIFASLSKSPVLSQKNLFSQIPKLAFRQNTLLFEGVQINSYFSSAISDFIREKLLEQRKSFSFETVMSHSGKIRFLEYAKGMGFRTYLYYVATEDPETNIDRVRIRVENGGHDVPEDRIRDRYSKSLTNLINAIKATNRAFIFDNSGISVKLIAEVKDGKEIEIFNSNIPNWFRKYVLEHPDVSRDPQHT